MHRYFLMVLIITVFAPATAWAQNALTNCAEQFIGGNVSNAPRVSTSAQGQPFGSNEHLCYRDDGVSFFASEYWPDEFAPRWVAYRLAPQNYGDNGCGTLSRGKANCYVKTETWDDYLACESKSDPFHTDNMLSSQRLGQSDFGSTGHDRGHIAPRQAFSWHVCGTYQTFSMANMSPQRAFLNQNLWMELEKQVLAWGFDAGPIYVVTGTTYSRFPHEDFEVYEDGGLDPNQIYGTETTMTTAVTQHHANHEANSGSGHILKPKRDANPSNVKSKVANMRIPTGYFKVIYRPAAGAEPAHAIGFLLPHSFENLNMLTAFYEDYPTSLAFWSFVSTVNLIEDTAGIRFPGIPNNMKDTWGDEFFFNAGPPRQIPRGTCAERTAQGILENSTKAQRIAACTDLLN